MSGIFDGIDEWSINLEEEKKFAQTYFNGTGPIGCIYCEY